MTKVVSLINNIDEDAWIKLIEKSCTSTWFQTKEAYDFFASLSDMFEPFFWGVKSEEELKGICVGYITREKNPLKQILTRRAIVIGGPMLSDDITNEELSALLQAVKNGLRHKTIYIETRNFNDYSHWKEVFLRNGFDYVPHLNFHIDTLSEDTINTNLGKSRKRDIRTSLREGAEIIENVTLDDVRSLYGLLNMLYKTKVKTPLFPLSFFEKLYSSGIGIFRLVRYGNRVVGGTICVGLTGKAVYEWFACGENGIIKNVYPSTMATFAGMEYAAKNGYPLFDMMGAGKPGEGYGVRDFKAKFGGTLVEHGRFLCVNQPMLYYIGKIGVKLLKKI